MTAALATLPAEVSKTEASASPAAEQVKVEKVAVLDDIPSAVGTLLYVAKERAKLKIRLDELDVLEASAIDEVQEAMGPAEESTYKGKPVFTWKSSTRRILDQKRLAADHPDLVEEYKRESVSRSFKPVPEAVQP